MAFRSFFNLITAVCDVITKIYIKILNNYCETKKNSIEKLKTKNHTKPNSIRFIIYFFSLSKQQRIKSH